jgi:hypothetical protein
MEIAGKEIYDKERRKTGGNKVVKFSKEGENSES